MRRESGCQSAPATRRSPLEWWFRTGHLLEQADGTQSQFRYFSAQRDAAEHAQPSRFFTFQTFIRVLSSKAKTSAGIP